MKSIKEIVLEAEKEGKVVFMTIDGPVSIDLDKFIQQPTDGLLYDLNRDRVTILTFIDNPKFVNDFATMKVITKLKEYYDFYDSVACLVAERNKAVCLAADKERQFRKKRGCHIE